MNTDLHVNFMKHAQADKWVQGLPMQESIKGVPK